MEAFSRKTEYVCNYCQKECTLICSLCKSVYYCDTICQKKDWLFHNDSCSILERVKKNIYVSCYEDRKAVLLEYNQHKRDLLMKRLLHKTRNRILQINKKLTSNFVISSESTILILYDYCEEYLYNILLMARIYFHRKDMGNAKKALEFFNNEWSTICRKNDFEKYFLSRFMVIQRSKRYQNLKKYINKYLQLYKCIMICTLELMRILIFETILYDYIKFIEGLMIKLGIYETYYGYIALKIGEIFIQRGMITNAIEIYSTAISQIPTGEKLNLLANHYTNCIVALCNNIAILYYSIGDYEQSYDSVNQSIKLLSFSTGDARESIINEKYIFKYISLYQLKAELEIDSKHYVVAYNNIKTLLLMINSNEEALKKKSLKEYNKMICLLNELLKKIDQGIEEKDISQLDLKHENSIEEYYKVNYEGEITTREIEQADFEKFLLFLIKLSMYQLRILNQTQPDPKTKFIESLPIFYSDEFKLCLTNDQRLDLKEITIMNLIRNKILNDPMLPVSISNLNFIKFFPERVAQFLIEKDTKEQFPNLIMLLKRFFKLNEIQLNNKIFYANKKNQKNTLFSKRPNFFINSDTIDFDQLKKTFLNIFKEGSLNDVVEISKVIDDTMMVSLLSKLDVNERNDLIKNLVDQIKRISINEKWTI